ncbi:MAG: plastoquinol--plastocyanin reductase [Ignavibacteriales bacterium CG07_land_8_20_14_0_80_59_12]|nr:MAG: plastoquinol--plastocyanin reductase [Ignavibacteriales bacterium CG07_land_8_20_14_0_80_59_12]
MNESAEPSFRQSKRDFLKYVLGGGLLAWITAVVYPILAYLKPPKQSEAKISSVKAGTLKDIPKDSGTIVRFGNKPAILIRTAQGKLRAFTATCTHLDCTVQYRKDMGLIWCACHNGKYDLNGRNIAGPPPRPLTALRVIVHGDDIFISNQP